MTDIATAQPDQPSRPRRAGPGRIVFVVGVVLVLILAALYFVAASAAGKQASQYDDDFAAWKDEHMPVLLAATAKLPKGTYLRKDATTKKALATQKKGCDAVVASRKDVTTAADALPTMGGGALGTFSSEHRDAGDRSERREKAVRAYAKVAAATLKQLETDCRWNIDYHEASTKSVPFFTKSEKYLIDEGTVEPGSVCRHKGGCFSSITSKKNAYADLRMKGVRTYLRSTVALLKSDRCAATSYGDACGKIATIYSGSAKAQLAAYKVIRASKDVVRDQKIIAAQAKETKIAKTVVGNVRKAVLAAVPELRKDKLVKKHPQWTDEFFSSVAALRLAELEDERDAIEKL